MTSFSRQYIFLINERGKGKNITQKERKMKLKEKVEKEIKKDVDFSAECYIGKDLYCVDYDAEDHELVIECYLSKRKHSDKNDLVLTNEDWQDYDNWDWPKGEITQIRDE